MNTATLTTAAEQSQDALRSAPRSAPHMRPATILAAATLHDFATHPIDYQGLTETDVRSDTLLAVLSAAATKAGLTHLPGRDAAQAFPAIAFPSPSGTTIIVTPWDGLLLGMTPRQGVHSGFPLAREVPTLFRDVEAAAGNGSVALLENKDTATGKTRSWRFFSVHIPLSPDITEKRVGVVADRIAAHYRDASRTLDPSQA